MALRSLVVADDVPEICNLVSKFLEPCGYAVHHARSGREALKLLEAHPCDILIADMLMPDGDGVELITVARRMYAGLRILAISGGGETLTSEYCLRLAKTLGVHATMAKPFDRKQFLSVVESLSE
jgi:CheY-like chemotaxis protein